MPSQNELAAQLGLSVPNPRGPFYGNVSQSPLPPSAQGLGDRVQRKEDKKVIDISTNGNGVAAARVRVPMLGATFEIRVDSQDVESFVQNPELARQVMERKFGEFRQMSQAVTQNMTPLQKASLAASMQSGGAPNPVAGGLGLAADMEMYMNDPDSRTLGNYLWSAVASAGDLLPYVAAVPPPSVMRAAQGVGKTKRRVATTGKYVGAPDWVTTPQDLGRMRADYTDRVMGGIAGREWYNDSSRWIDEASPQGMRQQVADTLAVTSQGTNVDSNLGFTVKGVNQAAAGLPIDTGRFPNTQNSTITSVLAGENPALGPKRQPFAQNLSVDWNPEMAQHPVNDIWQGRAFGYRHPDGKPWDAGFSPQQHAFMDEEMGTIADRLNQQNAGGFNDWDPLNTQAAGWTGAKINAGELKPEDAAMHYGSFSPKYEASATYEQIPGAGSGHLGGLLSGDYSTRAAYTNNPMSSWQMESGNDKLYDAAQMLQGKTRDMVGAYTPAGTGQLEINPGRVARPLVQSSGGDLLPGDRELLDVVESSRAYVDAQNAGAWHRRIPDSQTKAGDRNSLFVPLSTSPTADEMKEISEIAGANGFFAVDTGQGISLINNNESRTGVTLGKELKGDLGKALQSIGINDAVRTKFATGYLDYESALSSPGTGRATQKFLDDVTKNETIRQNIEPVLKEKARMNMLRDAEFASQYGMEVREDIQRARQVLFDDGIDGLVRMIKKNPELLPVVGAAVVLPVLVSGESDSSQPGSI